MNPLAPLAAVGSVVGGVLALATKTPVLPPFLSFLQGDAAEKNADVAADEKDLRARLPDLAGKLRQQLAGAGIDLSSPVGLSIGPSGSIEVDSDHPQWRQIEELVNGSPDLAGELSEFLAAAGRTSENLAPEAKLVLRTDDEELLVEKSLVAAASRPAASPARSPLALAGI